MSRFTTASRMLALLLLGVIVVGAAEAPLARTYWVWQRNQPLRAVEAEELRTAGVKELYWHAGTVLATPTGLRWREHVTTPWTELTSAASGMRLTPVVRLEIAKGDPFTPANAAALEKILGEYATTADVGEVQLDFESPDRLIGPYVDFLRWMKERGRPWRLSITALAHWSAFAAKFDGLADSIMPMFYDLDPQREKLADDRLAPLVNEAEAVRQFAGWKACPIPWRAGLPNFSRVTAVDAAGASRGHIRSWSWNDLFFSPALQPLQATREGESVFLVRRETTIGRTPLTVGQRLVVRYPDRNALSRLEKESQSAGAQSVVYFRLADRDDMSGYSAADLARSSSLGAPVCRVSFDASGRLSLTSASAADLLPRLSGTGEDDRGYTLEVRAEAPVWREAIAGEFARAKLSSDGPRTGDALLAMGQTTVRFFFTRLPAGATLTSGLVTRSPQAGATAIHWRIRNLDPQETWHSLD